MARRTYACGYRTRQAAEDELEAMFAEGDVSPGEQPEVEPYTIRVAGKVYRRWEITLADR